jgi:hypothetical protein
MAAAYRAGNLSKEIFAKECYRLGYMSAHRFQNFMARNSNRRPLYGPNGIAWTLLDDS